MTAPFLFDRYQLLAEVAGTPRTKRYQALDRNTREVVTVALVAEELAADHRFSPHFHRQVHIAAELVAPNLARILDYGRAGKTYFLVEEWVEGASLAEYVGTRGPLPVPDALAIAVGVAEGLAAAHVAGIAHGGLTPEDILIRDDGLVKVRDLGIAKPPGMPVRPETAVSRSIAHYISPEQAQGEAPTAASDVYALGALLYHMLAGRSPFEAATPLAVALKHVNEDPPPLRGLRSDVPTDVAALVATALGKQPGARYRDCGAMADAIANLAAFEPGLLPAPLVPAQRSFWQRLTSPPVSCLAALFVFLLVLTIGAALLVYVGAAARQGQPPAPTAATIAAPSFLGRSLVEAERLAVGQNLRLSVTRRPDPRAPLDVIVEQSPPPGRPVAPGGTVEVTVSEGPAPVLVPNLVGLDIGTAQSVLQREGLRAGAIGASPSAVENRGQVLGQNPSPGDRVSPGTAVDLITGAGPPSTATAPAPTATVPAAVPPMATPTAVPPATPSPTPTEPPAPPSPTDTPPRPSPTAPPTVSPTPTRPAPLATPSPTISPTVPLAAPTPTPTTVPPPAASPPPVTATLPVGLPALPTA